TYGAFGSVSRTRNEIVLSGTTDPTLGPKTRWVEYEFKCKPGDVSRRPCVVAPFHYRIDWQFWFAAMGDANYNPSVEPFGGLALAHEQDALSLLDHDPVKGRRPRFGKADVYEYHFTDWGSHDWWTRKQVGTFLPPLSLRPKGH